MVIPLDQEKTCNGQCVLKSGDIWKGPECLSCVWYALGPLICFRVWQIFAQNSLSYVVVLWAAYCNETNFPLH